LPGHGIPILALLRIFTAHERSTDKLTYRRRVLAAPEREIEGRVVLASALAAT